jgi:hypothetical protein
MSMERMPGPMATADRAAASSASGSDDLALRSQRIQMLATEHWSLLATRSLSWSESFSRATMFLTLLSGALVALGFVAQATSMGGTFQTFALLLLPLVIVVGWTTFVRLTEVNNEDAYWVTGMNRLRKAYIELDPELEHYFISGTTDDAEGMRRTYGAHGGGIGLHVLVTLPATVAFVDSALLAVLVAILANLWTGMSVASAGPVIGGIAFVVGIAVHFWFGYRAAMLYERARSVSTPAHFTAHEERMHHLHDQDASG